MPPHTNMPAARLSFFTRFFTAPGRHFGQKVDNMHKRTYNPFMKVEWDWMKAAANFAKHKIDFADAATVLVDDLAISIRDDTSEEERFVTVGMDALGRVLVVVLTWRKDRIRIISARKATPRERRCYEG